MRYSSKIKFDRLIGIPISIFFDIITRFVGIIARRDHSIKELNGKFICIFKLVGMGSIIEYTPSLKALKKTYPNIKIVFVTSKNNLPLFKMYSGYIDILLLIDDNSIFRLFTSTIKSLFKLHKLKIDTFINLEVYSSFSSIYSALSMARNRIGFYRKSTHFRKALDTHLIFFNTQKNIKEVYSQTARLLGCENIKINDFIQFNISDKIHKETDDFLQKKEINKFIVFNANASDLMLERRWPPEYWVAICNIMLSKTDYWILLSGSKSEYNFLQENIIKKIDNNSNKKILNIAGKLNLEQFIVLLKKCELFITNDSGPYHFAAVNNNKIISLWGPTDPQNFSDNSDYEIILKHNIYCSPCLFHSDKTPCSGDNLCMKIIQPQKVLQAIEEVLKMTMTESFHEEIFITSSYNPGVIIR